MRTTHSLVQVAVALMRAPSERHWGYALSQESGVRSGVLYPILRRMLNDGWLADGWEDVTETGGVRPVRRYYTLTAKGGVELGAILAAARSERRFVGIPNLAEGLA
ncbi:PadR family transcriptional regulator [Nocardia heshunensis]